MTFVRFVCFESWDSLSGYSCRFSRRMFSTVRWPRWLIWFWSSKVCVEFNDLVEWQMLFCTDICSFDSSLLNLSIENFVKVLYGDDSLLSFISISCSSLLSSVLRFCWPLLIYWVINAQSRSNSAILLMVSLFKLTLNLPSLYFVMLKLLGLDLCC